MNGLIIHCSMNLKYLIYSQKEIKLETPVLHVQKYRKLSRVYMKSIHGTFAFY
jgi:hypothetical protein